MEYQLLTTDNPRDIWFRNSGIRNPVSNKLENHQNFRFFFVVEKFPRGPHGNLYITDKQTKSRDELFVQALRKLKESSSAGKIKFFLGKKPFLGTSEDSVTTDWKKWCDFWYADPVIGPIVTYPQLFDKLNNQDVKARKHDLKNLIRYDHPTYPQNDVIKELYLRMRHLTATIAMCFDMKYILTFTVVLTLLLC